MKNTAKDRNGDQSNLPKQLFWDWNFDKIDWQNGYVSIIDRVIERATKEEAEELMRYYGRPKGIKTLKSEIKYLPDYAIEDVCGYFKMKKEDLACFARKQSRAGHWI